MSVFFKFYLKLQPHVTGDFFFLRFHALTSGNYIFYKRLTDHIAKESRVAKPVTIVMVDF